MTTTGNLGLKKPDYTDSADIGDINDNMDILDKEVEDRLSKGNGGTVKGELSIENNLRTNDLVPLSKDKYNVGSSSTEYLGGYFKNVYTEDVKYTKLIFTCSEIFSYSITFPDATIYCEGQRYTLNKSITYDRLVSLLTEAGETKTAGGFPFSAVTKTEVESEDTSYYDSAAYNQVYACVYDGYVAALVVTVVSSVSLLSDEADYSKAGAGLYLADEGDRFAIEGLLSDIGAEIGEAAKADVDSEITEGGEGLVSGGAVYTALQGLATANIVIAASDTDDKLKARANYICTGASDQTIINTAIASLSNGGKVVLLPGTYVLSGTVNIYVNNTWLCGCGNSTVIRAAEDSNGYIAVYGDYVRISDLSTVDVPIDTNANYTIYPALYLSIENITATYSKTYAIVIYGAGASDDLLNNCVRISNLTTICTDTETAVCALNIRNRTAVCIGCIGYDTDGTKAQSEYVSDNVTFIGCVGFDV